MHPHAELSLLRALCYMATAFVLAGPPVSASMTPATQSLAGVWRAQLDPDDKGVGGAWFARALPDARDIRLPGTTDMAKLGYALDPATMTYAVDVLRVKWPGTGPISRADQAGTLVRDTLYIGKVWYQRSITISAEWKDRYLQLRLERVVWATSVWVDEKRVGDCDSLVAEHRFDLGYLKPGPHRLTVRVDNGLIHNIGVIGHSYGPETQSRWNGIVGSLDLIAHQPVFVQRLRVTPAPDARSVRVSAHVRNETLRPVTARVRFSLQDEEGGGDYGSTSAMTRLDPGNGMVEETLYVQSPVERWDEFDPKRYRLAAVIESDTRAQLDGEECVAKFGFRQIDRDGPSIKVNGRRVFLRGVVDCCVFPRTGHPPTSTEEWLRLFRIVQTYGFNHVRFHTWCPPEAAFEAADQLGLYLAPETPFWVDDWTVENTPTHPPPLGRDTDVFAYVRNEIRRISDAYGNHPSFALFCMGNEFGMNGTDWEKVNSLLAEAKVHDPRRLYTASTARRSVTEDDFWVTHSTGKASTRGVGPPHTDWDFTPATRSTGQPLIAHETGERPVFPDYDHFLPRFTGPLKPHNYERLRRQLAASGLASQTTAFTRASASFQIVQYKAEHEGMLRTPDYAGYQLLMLNDFPGQSEALVGILDPFFESKGTTVPGDVVGWNGPSVPLARFKRYVWRSNEGFEAVIQLAHYGREALHQATARWSLIGKDGRSFADGTLGPFDAQTGALANIGVIRAPLSGITQPASVTLSVQTPQGTNQWTLWVYPPETNEISAVEVLVCGTFDATARQALQDGRRVLLLAHGLKNSHAQTTGFLSVYWSAGWWGDRFSSLGILCDPTHPALAEFPNEGHSDWQWQDLSEGATTFDLENAPVGFRPIVQLVPDFHYNRLLAQVFEARVGKGRLLVVGYDLEHKLDQRPAASQFRKSLLQYLRSAQFNPGGELDPALVEEWLRPSSAQ